MKKFIFVVFASVLPLMAMAANFSKTFVGYINQVPVKLQLTNNNGQLRGTFAYKNNFENTYIPKPNFIFGSLKNDDISLNTDKGKADNVSFEGKLLSTESDGVQTYELKGLWQDKMQLIDQSVTLKQLNLTADTKNPIVNQFKAEKNANDFYSTSVSYPVFVGKDLTTNETSINKTIESFIKTQVGTFENIIVNNYKQPEYNNLGADANTFEINNIITSSHPKLFSIRFLIFQMDYHAAHPNTTYASLNFNTKTGKEVTLASLFKSNSDYLKTIADIIRPELIKKFYPNFKRMHSNDFLLQIIKEGTKPTAQNYKVWNIYDGNLMITFPAYQVAAYVDGPQTILIPFSKLTAIAKPGGIIADWK